MSECFANAAVEASARGLICLLSDTDLAHRYYKSQSKGVTTFGDIGELILWLNAYQKEGRYSSATFSKACLLYTSELAKERFARKWGARVILSS